MRNPFDVADPLTIVDQLREPADDRPPAPAPPPLPEFVYVPTESLVRPGHDDEVIVELRPLTGGQIGLLVYTSVESLAECCGDGQPWAMVPTERLEYILLTTGADVVGYDVPIPLDHTRSGGVR